MIESLLMIAHADLTERPNEVYKERRWQLTLCRDVADMYQYIAGSKQAGLDAMVSLGWGYFIFIFYLCISFSNNE